MTGWWTRALVPALALMLLNWSMTCSRGHALFHDEEHDHDSEHAHHHGPVEHTHHTEPGDPDHSCYKPDANRQISMWRLDLTLVLQRSIDQSGQPSILDTATAVLEKRPASVVGDVPIAGAGGTRLLRRTERWLA